MKHILCHIVFVLAVLLCNVENIYATKAVPKIVHFTLPDGTKIVLKVIGDEFFGFKTLPGGAPVEVGKDGHLYYLNINSSGKFLTDRRVDLMESYAPSRYPHPELLRRLREGNLARTFSRARGTVPLRTESDGFLSNNIVLLVQFSDVSFSMEDPVGHFTELLNRPGYSQDGATGSAADYLHANFAGKARFSFEVSPVLTLPGKRADYGGQTALANDRDPVRMVSDACAAAVAAGVDFSGHDADADGFVDHICIIFAGHSEAEGAPGECIWPHQRNISASGIAAGNLKAGSYSCSSELRGAEGTLQSHIGTFCHEFLHAMGLPDMYDVNGDFEGAAPGLYGSLSIMDQGNFLNEGRTPPYLTSIEREQLGIQPVEDLLPDGDYRLDPVNAAGRLYRIPATVDGEYFLLECRKAAGWDACIPGEGLLVYHIDRSLSVHGGVASVRRWEYNNVNCYSVHECARVLTAAAVQGPEQVSRAFFPGPCGIADLSFRSRPMPLEDWAGYPVGLRLSEIRYHGDAVSFKVLKDQAYTPHLPYAENLSVSPLQHEAFVRWTPSSTEEQVRWKVRWKRPGEEEFIGSRIMDTVFCLVRDLTPGTGYEFEVLCIDGMDYGTGVVRTAQTVAQTSDMPYLFVKGEYRAGEEILLRVFNLVEKCRRMEWTLDGVPVHGDRLVLEEPGERLLKVSLYYTDGSHEDIYKKIRVR